MMKSRFSTVAFIVTLVVAIVATKRGLFAPSNSDHNPITVIDFSELEILPVADAVGPESIAFDPNGYGPYAGVSDGRIIKWDQHERRWIDFAITSPNREGCRRTGNHEESEHICGRPLGLRFSDKTGDLYIADAYMGLLVVGPDGGLATTVATEAEGVPFGFTNGVDIDQRTGVLYFTDSSTRYSRRNYLAAIITGDRTGRLMKYDPGSKQVVVLLNNLTFPNGVALSQNGQSVLVMESTSCRVLRYWLQTAEAGNVEVLTQLPGFPDNIKRTSKGEFWVGVYSRKGKVLEWALSNPWLGETFVSLPLNTMKLASAIARLRAIGLAVKLSEEGDVLEVLEERSGSLKFVSEVEEKDGDLWFGSVVLPYVGVYKKNTFKELKGKKMN
ncbi:hypothetical protein Ancab_013894 [Ancistrocladus abbreviatus]